MVVVNHCIGGGAGEKKEHINTDTKQRSNKSHMLKIGRWCLAVVREHSDQPQWCDHCTSGVTTALVVVHIKEKIT